MLHQGWIEGYFQDNLKKYGGEQADHSTMPESMEIDLSKVNDDSAYPVKVVLRHLQDDAATPEQYGHKVGNGLFRSANLVNAAEEDSGLDSTESAESTEIVNCKYVLGADGAHSWVRRQLGFKMIGEQTDYVWGVLDIEPLTNFPDIRNRCAIHSEKDGSVMIIPREGALVRFYIQLQDVEKDANGRVAREKITPEMILAQCQKIFAPYTITYEKISWFTAYQIGQRVTDNFSAHDRVFISGDAAHTHSPKAGQGMNVSMMDTYNLGWKLAHVVNGTMPRSVLNTYADERAKVAHDLINFDTKFAALFSGKPATEGEEGIDLEEFAKVFEQSHLFASGVDVQYPPSSIVAQGKSLSTQTLATGLPLGKRFNSYRVMNQSDSRVWEFQDRLKSDGRWRIVVFAGSILDPVQKSRVEKLAKHLDSPTSFIHKYTPAGKPRNSVFDVLTIHSAPRIEVELADFPTALRPEHEYWSLFVDDKPHHEPHPQAYKNYGVDPKKGAVIVVRPDQYVAQIVDLAETDKIEKFLSGCFIEQKK